MGVVKHKPCPKCLRRFYRLYGDLCWLCYEPPKPKEKIK